MVDEAARGATHYPHCRRRQEVDGRDCPDCKRLDTLVRGAKERDEEFRRGKRATEVLAKLKERLRAAIKSHEEHAKKVTDTRTIWSLNAYKDVLKLIEEMEAEG
jgi:hypothetical protein